MNPYKTVSDVVNAISHAGSTAPSESRHKQACFYESASVGLKVHCLLLNDTFERINCCPEVLLSMEVLIWAKHLNVLSEFHISHIKLIGFNTKCT